jgi:hypothetical protein
MSKVSHSLKLGLGADSLGARDFVLVRKSAIQSLRLRLRSGLRQQGVIFDAAGLWHGLSRAPSSRPLMPAVRVGFGPARTAADFAWSCVEGERLGLGPARTALGGCGCLGSDSIVAGWVGVLCHAYLVWNVGFRWFCGLTGGFWRVFEEIYFGWGGG